ncbi:6-phosphogluconolactonase [Larkinella arboricola]|uniref:6-phosphogluconolactonase n=1 Tax=Larkinella arboricola TaxID=643671 RepID=A0A327WZE3_LARAB|nr:lactonase family protein [Larkinella arboricola]RAJ97785.1 6-phosphogluconolactonase [Larkinella arboricola]
MKKLVLLIALLMSSLAKAQSPKEILYVGTYSTRGSEGIYVLEFDRASGSLKQLQTVSNAKSPSFLAIHPSGKYLYSVNEAAANSGGVSSYSIEPKTGKLTMMNQQSSHGRGPCHIAVDQTGKLAFVSNYGGGTFTVLPIQNDGRLGAATDTLKYEGKGAHPQRQDKPHIHSATVSPNNRFVYVCDLGTDKVYIYEFDKTSGKVKPAVTPYASVAPGSGPRHIAIHPTGKYLYLVEEINSSVATFAIDNKTGALTLLQDNVKTLPADFTGNNTSADIHTDPKGKFLYQSNRGYDGLAILSIANDGKVTLVGQQPTEGKTPRNFMIDPKGEYAFAANQDTDNIVVYKLDGKTGRLTPTGTQIKVPAPVCLKLFTVR